MPIRTMLWLGRTETLGRKVVRAHWIELRDALNWVKGHTRLGLEAHWIGFRSPQDQVKCPLDRTTKSTGLG